MEVTNDILRLAHGLRTSYAAGYMIAETTAMWVATHGADAARGYLRGLWYMGVTVDREGNKAPIAYHDFKALVRAAGMTWEDFLRLP